MEERGEGGTAELGGVLLEVQAGLGSGDLGGVGGHLLPVRLRPRPSAAGRGGTAAKRRQQRAESLEQTEKTFYSGSKFVFHGFGFNQRPRLCLGVTVFLTSQANLERGR